MGAVKINKIKFTNKNGHGDFYPPQPASQCIPDWYKNTQSYTTETKTVIDSVGNSTIKRCIPVFDALTSGYILFTPCDLWVTFDMSGLPFYNWSTGPTKIDVHPLSQAEKYPVDNRNDVPFPKWINDWIITTPKGYSCLFINPMHNPNPWFTILPGIVDTDNYSSTVNFPFTLKNTQEEHLIPAGTPMVQIIPFKRESWKMDFGNEKDIKLSDKIDKKLRLIFFNSYKTMFWNRKEYK